MSTPTIPIYGHAMSVSRIRRVWAAVTSDPQATVRELAEPLDMSYGDVERAIIILRDAGYIEQSFRSARARRVIVPFCEVRQ